MLRLALSLRWLLCFAPPSGGLPACALLGAGVVLFLGSHWPVAAAAQAPPGEQSVLLMVVDGTTQVPRSLRHYENGGVTNLDWSAVSTLDDYAFERDTSLAKLYEEMSYGQTTLVGDTIGFMLPHAPGDLTWQEWVAAADTAARGLGFEPDSYDRLLYVLPGRPKGISVTGLASGKVGWCTFNSYVELGCLFHELGHTFGLRHAAELFPDGSDNGLGDKSDGLMGSGLNAHVNAINKHLAGWIDSPRRSVFDQTGSTVVTLAPQSSSTQTLQVVQVVNVGARPSVGVVDTFLSYRDVQGFDEQLQLSIPDLNGDDVDNAVLVHQWPRQFGSDTFYLRALGVGDVYDEHGVRVEVLGIDGSGASVSVSRAPYAPVAPTVSLTPTDTTANRGQFVFYTLTIQNHNDPASQSFDSHYDVSLPQLPPDWTVGWTVGGAKTVPPGQSRSFTILVGSPRTAAPGRYDFVVDVQDHDGGPGIGAQVAGAYTVAAPPGDMDGDLWPDELDNCPNRANLSQLDSGGVGLGSGPDGIGDACQCGDVTDDGIVTSVDAIFVNRFALGLAAPGFSVAGKCDVTGDGVCNTIDAIFINRAALSLSAPSFGQNCEFAVGSP